MKSTSTKNYELKLCGQKILLKSPGNEAELTEQVLELVKQKLQAAEERSNSQTAPHQVTLLALLDLASDYIQAKKKTVEFKRQIGAKSEHLMNLLESSRRQ